MPPRCATSQVLWGALVLLLSSSFTLPMIYRAGIFDTGVLPAPTAESLAYSLPLVEASVVLVLVVVLVVPLERGASWEQVGS